MRWRELNKWDLFKRGFMEDHVLNKFNTLGIEVFKLNLNTLGKWTYLIK